ncbi:hypothetical protein CRYUN_Cryun15aG0080500 [Craigia yunnanensis]
MRGLQLPLSQTQRIRLQRAFEKLHSLSSKANSDTSVTAADNIPVNYEDAFLKYQHPQIIQLIGHGTADLNGELVATVCGVVERINKLVYVRALRARREENEYVGVGARFGPTLKSKEKHPNHIRLALADPPDCCRKPRNQLIGEVILVCRGNCSFTVKANVTEEAGASAILIINNQIELFKMVCESNAERPAVDIAEVFFSLMAVGTILCATYWSAWTAREVDIEQDKLLKDALEEFLQVGGAGSSGFVDINTMSAVLFVVIASCFLVMLYKLMSLWWFQRFAKSFTQVPFFGAVSHLTLAVCPFCIVIAVVWVVYRRISFAWISQDILGIALIITVLQIVRVPNLKVGTVLLGCAFLYDILWVFVSQWWSQESVMTVVACGGKSVYFKGVWPIIEEIAVAVQSNVAPKRWRLEINFSQDAVLMLSSINMPDRIQAEVRNFQHDGSLQLQARSQKYGKLVAFSGNPLVRVGEHVEARDSMVVDKVNSSEQSTVLEEKYQAYTPLEMRQDICRIANAVRVLSA